MSKAKTARRRAREYVVQGLYQAAINNISAFQVARNIKEDKNFTYADEKLFDNIFTGVHDNRENLRRHIVPLLDRPESELNPIENAILLMAAHELMYMPETPYPVIINEAIEVGKTFGGTDSHKFINGILDKLAAQTRPNDPKRS